MGPHLTLLYHAMLFVMALSLGIVVLSIAVLGIFVGVVLWEAFYDQTRSN